MTLHPYEFVKVGKEKVEFYLSVLMVNEFPSAGANYIYAYTIELYDSLKVQSECLGVFCILRHGTHPLQPC
jgi:hypothetical protein